MSRPQLQQGPESPQASQRQQDPQRRQRPQALPAGARVVVKVGSSSLTRSDGGLDLNRIDILTKLLAGLRSRGHDVVLVSSGAVAAGLPPLGLEERPTELRLLQAAASVGQGRLMARWQQAMSNYGQVTAQVLLTANDVSQRDHYRTVRETFDALLSMGATPIVNENDAVANAEFNLGDNDHLAALVSHLVSADVLLLLTDVDGLWTAKPGTPGAEPIRYVPDVTGLSGVDVSGRGSGLGTGGMATKLQAALIACASGTNTMILAADDAGKLLAGEELPAELGTWFAATGPHRRSRRLWMAHASVPQGRVKIDNGAARAVTDGKRSLLLPGLVAIKGEFEAGDVVEVEAPSGVIARGVTRYSSADLEELLAERQAGGQVADHVTPLIHRDDLAELPSLHSRS